MKPFTWPIVVGSCFFATLILGVCVWLIDRGHAPPSLLLAPISTMLVGGAAAAAAYMRGLMTAPPGQKLVPSVAPPPTEAELLGLPPMTPSTIPVEVSK